MLLYIGIFVAILIATPCARFFYTAISNKTRSVHPSDRRKAITDNSEKLQKEETGFKTNSNFRVLSVQEGGSKSLSPGKKRSANPVACHKLKSARAIHEEKLLSMNKSYKARRRAESGPLSLEMVSKPFTRKVAPWAKDYKIAVRSWKVQNCPIPIAEPTYSELIRTKSGNVE